jgi:methionyl-tRNA formyltransferase
MKIIFMGTPTFAIPGLNEIHRRGIEIAAVVTRPDRPAGRGKALTMPPVKERGLELGLDLWQPSSLKAPNFIDRIKELQPDLFVISAYGKFIPDELLSLARYRGINLHPSLLPRYRGAAPIQWALINGDSRTGVTIIEVAEKMDAGAIYSQKSVDIFPDDNAGTLFTKLAEEGGRLLADAVEQIAEGKGDPQPQDESKVTLAPRLSKEEGRINWQMSATDINNRIRGFYPWPGAFTTLSTPKGARSLKIIQARVFPGGGGRPGEVLEADGDVLIVSTGDGTLRLLEVQLEGKRPLAAEDFLRGHRIASGEILGGGMIFDKTI